MSIQLPHVNQIFRTRFQIRLPLSFAIYMGGHNFLVIENFVHPRRGAV